jgi:hypothetical protein
MLSCCCRMKIALVLISFLVASCSSLPTGKQDSVVGEWRYADNVQSCRYHFKKDATFTGEVHLQKRLVSKFRGTWAMQDDFLLYRYLGDELGRIPAGTTDRDKLLSIEKEAFQIEAADGSRRRYIRIR